VEIADRMCVKWKVKPEYVFWWVALTRDFIEATRAEEGNLLFEWSRSVDDPDP
jgi:quinol monooxygenase YgiN